MPRTNAIFRPKKKKDFCEKNKREKKMNNFSIKSITQTVSLLNSFSLSFAFFFFFFS